VFSFEPTASRYAARPHRLRDAVTERGRSVALTRDTLRQRRVPSVCCWSRSAKLLTSDSASAPPPCEGVGSVEQIDCARTICRRSERGSNRPRVRGSRTRGGRAQQYSRASRRQCGYPVELERLPQRTPYFGGCEALTFLTFRRG
jgi:hypothetical protein